MLHRLPGEGRQSICNESRRRAVAEALLPTGPFGGATEPHCLAHEWGPQADDVRALVHTLTARQVSLPVVCPPASLWPAQLPRVRSSSPAASAESLCPVPGTAGFSTCTRPRGPALRCAGGTGGAARQACAVSIVTTSHQ